ncbi:hypothetical protein [Novosphingobium sp. PP1Y]|uniref:hypothetical protein n=1 Tax=Novosphingobium sp. PP1Y TaxID=702113 RepID=UPI0011D20CB5|nr:hypothetical protein [Novosphingobium sp. PP1Y]
MMFGGGVLDQDDPQGGRWIKSASNGEQRKPGGDNRLRVNLSKKFYIAQFLGSSLNIYETAERVVHKKGGASFVIFEGSRYQLRSPDDLGRIIDMALAKEIYVNVGGVELSSKWRSKIELFSFIYLTTKAALKNFQNEFGSGNAPHPDRRKRRRR